MALVFFHLVYLQSEDSRQRHHFLPLPAASLDSSSPVFDTHPTTTHLFGEPSWERGTWKCPRVECYCLAGEGVVWVFWWRRGSVELWHLNLISDQEWVFFNRFFSFLPASFLLDLLAHSSRENDLDTHVPLGWNSHIKNKQHWVNAASLFRREINLSGYSTGSKVGRQLHLALGWTLRVHQEWIGTTDIFPLTVYPWRCS